MGTAFSVSNRLVMLNQGRVALHGTPDEFRVTKDRFVRDFIDGRAPEDEDVSVLLASS
jgi:ABC-type transporter Mla maintaining outer membrane lipid asymmetry ATPase subunit MlaF